jgi:hypothetical protein
MWRFLSRELNSVDSTLYYIYSIGTRFQTPIISLMRHIPYSSSHIILMLFVLPLSFDTLIQAFTY